MNRKITAIAIGTLLGMSSLVSAQTQGQGNPSSSTTSPQTTTNTPQDTTGMNNNSGARAGALNSGAAGAQAGLSDDRNGAFDALDKNHQGYLRATDVASNKQLSAKFKNCDINHDGKLDREEYNTCVRTDQIDYR